jgi:hypothetical protein
MTARSTLLVLVAMLAGCDLFGQGRGNLNGDCNPDGTCNVPRLTCRQIANGTWNTWKCQP